MGDISHCSLSDSLSSRYLASKSPSTSHATDQSETDNNLYLCSSTNSTGVSDKGGDGRGLDSVGVDGEGGACDEGDVVLECVEEKTGDNDDDWNYGDGGADDTTVVVVDEDDNDTESKNVSAEVEQIRNCNEGMSKNQFGDESSIATAGQDRHALLSIFSGEQLIHKIMCVFLSSHTLPNDYVYKYYKI